MMKIEINLDDETEVSNWVEMHGTLRGRALANKLGFAGTGAVKSANALANYAWNKHTAIELRKAGNIPQALVYEAICDKIYSQDILGRIECW